MVVVFDPGRHCGAAGHQAGGDPCRLPRGWGTSHPGGGRCKLHGGSTPDGVKSANRELAARAVAKLGIPLGNGDPFVLLEHTVQHAEGNLAATADALVAAVAYDPKAEGPKPVIPDVSIAAGLYQDAIKTAGRTGKAAVDAKVADRQITVDLAMANLINRFIGELFDRIATLIPREERPVVEVWAKARLEELALEFEHGGRIH